MASVFTRRVIAYILDFFVVSAFMLYFIVLEKSKGATVGKALMYLEVRSRNGARINWAQAIVRNLSKIYWIPVIFDWLIGKLLGAGNNRFLGSVTKTVVIDELR